MIALSKVVADLGENPAFVAFNAHCWFAFSLVYFIGVHGFPVVPLCVLVLMAAAVKEFRFDAIYEKTPPQTFWDNLEDFGGYAVGAMLAVAAVELT